MNIEFTTPVTNPEQRPRRWPWLMAIGLGLAVLVGGAICWALVGFFVSRVYLAIAFFIGTGAAVAVAYPFKPIDKRQAMLLIIPTMVITLASIVLGEYLMMVALVIRETQCSLGVALQFVALLAGELLWGTDLVISLILGVAGAVLGYVNVVRRARQ